MNSQDLTVRSENKMVSKDTWNTLYQQAAEIIKSNFLPSSIKTPAQAIAVILTGRELGIGMMEAFRGIHIIDNRPSISPQLMMSLIYNSGIAENIKIESTPADCTVSGNRKGQPPVVVKFTEEDAKNLGLLFKDNWKKQKQNMLRWRAISAWARLTCPDVIGGLYTPEELENSDDVVGKDVSALDMSEKIHGSAENYDRWAQEIKTKILDDILTCETAEQLSHVKKQYAEDMGRLMDEDRAYIQERFDSQFQNIVSSEAEPEIQPSGEAIDRKTGQEVELEEKAPVIVIGSENKGPKDPNADLITREAFGKEFLPKVVKELELCHTRAQITMFKNKIVQDRMKLLPEAKEYLDALIKQALTKIKG